MADVPNDWHGRDVATVVVEDPGDVLVGIRRPAFGPSEVRLLAGGSRAGDLRFIRPTVTAD